MTLTGESHRWPMAGTAHFQPGKPRLHHDDYTRVEWEGPARDQLTGLTVSLHGCYMCQISDLQAAGFGGLQQT